MIVSFGSKDTEKIWNGDRVKKMPNRNSTNWTKKIEDD